MSLSSIKFLENFSEHKYTLGYPSEEFIVLSTEDKYIEAMSLLLKAATESIEGYLAGSDDSQRDSLREVLSFAAVSIRNIPIFIETRLGGVLIVDSLDTILLSPDHLVITRHPLVAARERQNLIRQGYI